MKIQHLPPRTLMIKVSQENLMDGKTDRKTDGQSSVYMLSFFYF